MTDREKKIFFNGMALGIFIMFVGIMTIEIMMNR